VGAKQWLIEEASGILAKVIAEIGEAGPVGRR
jgi:hypothetical protein